MNTNKSTAYSGHRCYRQSVARMHYPNCDAVLIAIILFVFIRVHSRLVRFSRDAALSWTDRVLAMNQQINNARKARRAGQSTGGGD